MKKVYLKPEIQVVTIKYQAPLLVGSDPAKSNNDPDELNGSADKYYYLD